MKVLHKMTVPKQHHVIIKMGILHLPVEKEGLMIVAKFGFLIALVVNIVDNIYVSGS